MITEQKPIFEAKGIHKEFINHSRLQVLANLDFSLSAGETAAITGTSGTGKTTLLHILGALDRPSNGDYLYKGENVFQKSDNELSSFRNREIGFVFQFHHLLPEFNAFENVLLPGLIAGHKKHELDEYALFLLERVGVATRAGHKVGELSGGEQQRIALARALIMKPALLLADEPTGNLDPKTGERVFELIQELNQTLDLTIVMVTHNNDLARQMDRCLTLRDGRLHE
ncbi:MAG: ABC transporter ATP-binding protein [Desulfobulbaceae bacterium]|nr:ABC transporter ATP-binding protein [Desulfobulbaceae bacterium]HIJ79414.1 ABC transporter ATP-binding protein [Deltaproteobacteria bacterium]